MLPADVTARFSRARGHETLFICATDEHGTPTELAALGLWHIPIPENEMHGNSMTQILAAGSLAITGGVICIALAAWMFILTARINFNP